MTCRPAPWDRAAAIELACLTPAERQERLEAIRNRAIAIAAFGPIDAELREGLLESIRPKTGS
jgi:hypothetical protein